MQLPCYSIIHWWSPHDMPDQKTCYSTDNVNLFGQHALIRWEQLFAEWLAMSWVHRLTHHSPAANGTHFCAEVVQRNLNLYDDNNMYRQQELSKFSMMLSNTLQHKQCKKIRCWLWYLFNQSNASHNGWKKDSSTCVPRRKLLQSEPNYKY